MKRILILLAFLALVGGGGWYWHSRAVAVPAANARTESVGRGELLATVSATGTLEPEDVVDIGAQVGGMVKEFGTDANGKPIDYGSEVVPGTELARIDASLYQAKVEQSRAQVQSAERRLDQAKAKVDQAKAKVDQAKANTLRAQADVQQANAKANQASRDWERAQRLGTGGAQPQSDYDAARAAYDTSRAAVAVAEATVAQMKAAETDSIAAVADAVAAAGDAEASVALAKAVLHQDEINLGYCTITSPVKGTVIDRRVTIGQTVQSSFNTPSLFLIAKDLKRMKVWASVNEADVSQVHVGQPVEFTVDAYPNQTFKGTVGLVRLNAANVQNVVTYTVEVLADNPDGKLLPYMTANLRFEVARRDGALLVPNAALRYRPSPDRVAPDARKNAKGGDGKAHDKGTVWVQDGGFVRPVRVKLGLTDGNVTEVVGGNLSEGAAVVVGEGGGAQAKDATNPFAPNVFGGKKS